MNLKNREVSHKRNERYRQKLDDLGGSHVISILLVYRVKLLYV